MLSICSKCCAAAQAAALNHPTRHVASAASTASALFSRPEALPRLIEAVTRHSADPAQMADAIAAASLAARMPSAALFDDISFLLAAVRSCLPVYLPMHSRQCVMAVGLQSWRGTHVANA